MADTSNEDCDSALADGDADRALQAAIERLRHDKNDVDALAACYRAYTQKNDSANAIKVLQIILKVAPRADWAYVALGRLSVATGKLRQAESMLRLALQKCPDDAEAHASAGILFSELNKLSAGEWHFRRALEIAGPDCDVLSNLALNLTQQGRTDDADVLYRQANEIAPDNVRALAYWSKLKEIRGELDEAKRLLARADAKQPGSVQLLQATLLARSGRPEEALALIDARPRLNGDALLERGQLHDRLGRYAEAWSDFEAANSALAEEAGGLSYDTAAVEAFFDALKGFFFAESMSGFPVASLRTDVAQPIFIVGAPRSGTTLVERILATHSRIQAGGELPFIADLREFSEKILPGPNFPQNLAAIRLGDERYAAQMFRDYYLVRRDERIRVDHGIAFVTDKMPFNEIYLPLIRMAFPQSPVIYVLRHPLDVAISMFSNKLNHGFHCSYRFENIIHHLTAVLKLHRHYRQQSGQDDIEVRYESMVGDPEAATRRLLDYIGVPFEAGCLEFHNQGRYSATPSYSQVTEPITNRSVGRHGHYQKQLLPYSVLFEPLLELTGYASNAGHH